MDTLHIISTKRFTFPPDLIMAYTKTREKVWDKENCSTRIYTHFASIEPVHPESCTTLHPGNNTPTFYHIWSMQSSTGIFLHCNQSADWWHFSLISCRKCEENLFYGEVKKSLLWRWRSETWHRHRGQGGPEYNTGNQTASVPVTLGGD